MSRSSAKSRCLSLCAWSAVAVMFAGSPAHAEIAETQPEEDFTSLSLEDLMDVEIYSAGKRNQPLAEAAAAATVISEEDIRRSGMTSIPELLRLAPGLNVARINANQWAISSRGFNELYAGKMLVLMDGRSVYTPLFSGVYWETLDYMMPDLDRIEVIRGPGATLWGANAVNGVINITTKSAKDTQGWLVTGDVSNVTRSGGVRYGLQIDDLTYARFYTKYRDTHNFDYAEGGGEAHDGWEALRGGFRIDRYATDQDTLTLQGDAYTERVGQTADLPTVIPPFTDRQFTTDNFSGGNILARWTHEISPDSEFSLQFYYDRLNRNDHLAEYALDTFDLEFQHRFQLDERQEIIYGANVRFLSDQIENTETAIFEPTSRDDYLVSVFIQDDIEVVKDQFHLILGSKFEYNSYSGMEVQPGVRAIWTPDKRNTVWGAVSRAVRTPSRWEQDSQLVFGSTPMTEAGLPGEINTFGDKNFDSEDLTAFELGYRVQATSALSLDFSAFLNHYNNLRSGRIGTPTFQPTPAPSLLIPVHLGNDIDGNAFGAEVAANLRISDDWRIVASYSWLQVQLERGEGVDATLEHTFEGTAPENQFQVRSYYDLTRNIELNAALYYVDNLPTGDIPSNTRVDVGITWRPTDGLDLSVGVQNLLDDGHPEFDSGLFLSSPSEIPRTIYGQLTWRY